jgi:hypothetical protein
MQRAWTFLGVAVAALTLGCPDPCVFTRAACLVDSDCGDGQLCRLDRAFEARCAVVKGACIAIVDDPLGPPCGSVGDCADDACCDPVRNVCVAAALYPGPDVDELTCRADDTTQIAPPCLTDADCPVVDGVDDAFDCVASVGEAGLCLAPCDTARPCVDDGVCTNGHCFFRLGTPCEDDTGVDARHCGDAALDVCETLDVNFDETSGYCTRSCDDARPCPTGFECDETGSRSFSAICRRR